MKIGSSEWQQAYHLLDEALELPPAEHGRWLNALAPDKAHLRPLLESMLADRAKIETSDFLRSLPHVTEFIDDKPIAAQPGGLAAGVLIGPYRLISELGMGGMGAVWLAVRADGAMKRQVALKLPHAGPMQKQLAARFARERDILAALAHPHIARLYDAGTTDNGQPYIALEYVEGTPITTYCDEKKLSIDGRLALFRQVLAAVHFAHTNLVIHRDLKPSNIMVTHEGYVRLLDFGIAKFLTGDTTKETELTQIGGRALTPDYASPEQISGAQISTASDVYSLGVVLYELLVGARPYKLKRGTRGELEDAILAAEAPSLTSFIHAASSDTVATARSSTPLRLKAQLTGELNTLVKKAMQKNPHDRYATADAFRADIERYLADQPILAQGETIWYSAKKFVLRNRLPVAAAATVFLALLIGLGATMWQAREAARQADVAHAERARAESSAALAAEQRNIAVAEAKRAEENLALANAQSKIAIAASERTSVALNAERAERRRANRQEALAREQTKLAQVETAKATAVQNYLLDIFKKNSTNQSDPIRAQKTTVRELLDLGANEIDSAFVAQPEAKIALIDTFSQLYAELGLREQAVPLAEKRKTLAIAAYGAQSDKAFDATYEHVVALLGESSRRVTEAESNAADAMHAQLVATLDKKGDRTSVHRAKLLMIGCRYRISGRFGGGPKACDEALEILRRYHRNEREYVAVLNELSDIARTRLDFVAQEALAEEALTAIGESGTDDAAANVALSALISARVSLYKMKEADEAATKLYRLLLQSKTPFAARTLRGYITYAVFLRSNFRYAEARDVLEKLLQKAEGLFATSSSLTFHSTRVELANTLTQMGEITAALAVFERTLADIRRDSSDTAFEASNLVFHATALVKGGQDAEARIALARAKAIFDKFSVGSDSPLAILRSALLAELDLRAGKPEEALTALLSTTVREPPGMIAPGLQLARRQSLAGRTLVALDRLDEAQAAIAPYLRAIETSSARPYLALLEADMLVANASLQSARRQHQEALASLLRAMTLYEKREIAGSPFLAEKKLMLAGAYARAGRNQDAASLLATIKSSHAALIDKQAHLAKMVAAIETDLGNPPTASVIAKP